MKTKETLPLSKAYTLLNPGPVVMITSRLKSKTNIMTMSWLSMLDFDPPIVACCIGEQSLTFELIKQTKEFAINIPTSNLVKKVLGCGRTSGKKIDKFKKFKLTQEKPEIISAPLIAECFANLECKVIDASLIKKHNLFIAQIMSARILPQKGIPKTLHYLSNNQFFERGKILK